MRPPQGSVITDAFKAMWIGLKYGRGNMDAAKSAYREEYGVTQALPWTDLFVEELKRALVASGVVSFLLKVWGFGGCARGTRANVCVVW